MAVEVKVRTASPPVLTDLRPGRVRRTIYSEQQQIGAVTAVLLGLGALALTPGVGRAIFGASPRTLAREQLEDELLAAQVAGQREKVREIQGKIALIAREFDPTSEAERTAKLEAIRESLPLDLARREVTLEAERAQAAREDLLFPIVREERLFALRNQEQLAAERAERQVEFLQTEAARRELFAEETEKAALLNDQLARQNELIAAAIGPLDQAQAAQFARERLFPPGKALPFAPIGALSVPKFTVAGAGF